MQFRDQPTNAATRFACSQICRDAQFQSAWVHQPFCLSRTSDKCAGFAVKTAENTNLVHVSQTLSQNQDSVFAKYQRLRLSLALGIKHKSCDKANRISIIVPKSRCRKVRHIVNWDRSRFFPNKDIMQRVISGSLCMKKGTTNKQSSTTQLSFHCFNGSSFAEFPLVRFFKGPNRLSSQTSAVYQRNNLWTCSPGIRVLNPSMLAGKNQDVTFILRIWRTDTSN